MEFRSFLWQQPSTIKKRPPLINKMKPNPSSLGKPDNPPDQPVIRTESDLINQAISGSPRTSRKLNNKFLEVNQDSFCRCWIVVVIVGYWIVVDVVVFAVVDLIVNYDSFIVVVVVGNCIEIICIKLILKSEPCFMLM